MDDTTGHNSFVHELRSSIHSRDYERAKALCSEHNDHHRELKRQQLAELAQTHNIERSRLRSAKRIALERARSAGQLVFAQREREMGERQFALQSAHDDRLHVFSNLLQAREHKRPIVYSTVTNALRQSEMHLGKLRMFDEAAVARDKLNRREALEHEAVIKERERKIRDCIEIKRDQFLDEERTLYTRMKGELQVQKARNAADEHRAENTFHHLQRDMARAHYRQQMQCVKSTATDLSTALSGGTEQVSRTIRGTTMLRKMKGNRFTIPSLCNVYGSLLDDPVTPSEQRMQPRRPTPFNEFGGGRRPQTSS
jgi:hypothetical protein